MWHSASGACDLLVVRQTGMSATKQYTFIQGVLISFATVLHRFQLLQEKEQHVAQD